VIAGRGVGLVSNTLVATELPSGQKEFLDHRVLLAIDSITRR
jgi:hypothetical protein